MIYSMDLRERVVAAVQRGEPIVAVVARRRQVPRTTMRDWRNRAGQGALEPGVGAPKSPTKITPRDDQLTRDMIAQRSGITANQLRELLSVEVAESNVCRRLKKLGLTLKKGR